jgi:hypothetical protein
LVTDWLQRGIPQDRGPDQGPVGYGSGMAGGQAGDARSQQAALERLWTLMAAEREARDAAAAMIATGGAAFPRPWPETPTAAQRAKERADADQWTARGLGCGVAPDAPPDRLVVRGGLRELLLGWLPQMAYNYRLTRAQLHALDDLTAGAGIADALRILREERFSRVHEDMLEGDVLIFCLHPAGLLAILYAPWSDDGPVLRSVNVYGCAQIIDLELFEAGVPGMNWCYDEAGRRRNLAAGRISCHVQYPAEICGSLRVQLAALQAFGRVIAPWPEPAITGWLGPDRLRSMRDASDEAAAEASRAATRTLLASLPEHVHQLLGPQLTQQP